MKRLFLFCILFCMALPIVLAEDDDIPFAVERALYRVNGYHPTELSFEDDDLEVTWTLAYYDELHTDCKSIPDPSMPQGLMMYDIQFLTPIATYHYRVDGEGLFLIRCHELYPTIDGVSPYITDSLNEMNALLDSAYTLNDVEWTWEERWFSFEELGCGLLSDDEPQHVRGYRLFLTLNDHVYEYRISADRMVLMACSTQGAHVRAKLSLIEDKSNYSIGETIPMLATVSNRGSQDTEAPILLTINIPYGLAPTEVTTEGRTIDVVPMVDHLRDTSDLPNMPDDTTRVAADGSLLLVAEENNDITMSYTFRLAPLPANASRTFVFSFNLVGERPGQYTLSADAEIEDAFSSASDSKFGA